MIVLNHLDNVSQTGTIHMFSAYNLTLNIIDNLTCFSFEIGSGSG